jgi:enolase
MFVADKEKDLSAGTLYVAKYNQLLRIEEELGKSAVYPGIKAFNVQQ